jgi:hypothetical protein
VQISRVTKAVFPWALIYDIPTETDFVWNLCPLLENWDSERDALADYPETCPHQDAHDINVLCPYGSGGSGTSSSSRPVSGTGAAHRDPPRFTGVRGNRPQPRLGTPRSPRPTSTSSRCLEHRSSPSVACESKQTFARALADPRCRCSTSTARAQGRAGPTRAGRAAAGNRRRADRIGATDFAAWVGNWDSTHWQDTAPLVFLNGCETAALDPEDVVSFVDALAGLRRGVIGTEIR